MIARWKAWSAAPSCWRAALSFGFISLGLTACGGGGSSGGGSSAPQTPGFTLASQAVTYDATIADYLANIRVPISFKNVSSTQPIHTTVTVEGTAVASANVVISPDPNLNSALNITLSPAIRLPPNTYSGSVTVSMCMTSPCGTPMEGSGSRVAVTYNVTRPTGDLAVRVSGSTPIWIDRIKYFPSGLDSFSAPAAVSFSNLKIAPYVEVTHSANFRTAFVNGSASVTSASLAAFLLVQPAGIYNERLTVKACTESTCVNELDGSPFTIDYDYRVGDTIRLAGANLLKVVPLPSTDFVWNESLGKFIVAQPGNTPSDNGRLVSYDPVNDAIATLSSTGAAPFPLHQTKDNRYLYVGERLGSEIKRFDIPSFTLSQTIALGNSASGSPFLARDIESAPNDSKLLAVPMGDAMGTRLGNTLKIFDDGVARPSVVAPVDQSVLDPLIESVCWAGNQSLIGARFEAGKTHISTNGGAVFEMSVGMSGAALLETTSNTIAVDSYARSELHCSAGLVYSDTGRVFNPIDNSVFTLSIPGTAAQSVLPDDIGARLFVLPGDNGSNYAFRIFDKSTNQQSAQLSAMVSPGDGSNRRLVRWGNDGIAFSMGGAGSLGLPLSIRSPYLVLVKGPFFAQ